MTRDWVGSSRIPEGILLRGLLYFMNIVSEINPIATFAKVIDWPAKGMAGNGGSENRCVDFGLSPACTSTSVLFQDAYRKGIYPH